MWSMKLGELAPGGTYVIDPPEHWNLTLPPLVRFGGKHGRLYHWRNEGTGNPFAIDGQHMRQCRVFEVITCGTR